ncbi:MAG: hypothetical protein ACXVYM_06955 [Gaiellaceae bacterium]
MDIDLFRQEAEEFVSALDREYYLHFSGQQDSFDIEPVYDEHAGLFSRQTVDALRQNGNRKLLEFAVHGLIGRATKAEEAELARREATLELEVDGETMPFRQAAVRQSNEPDADRRAAIEDARMEVTERELDPLLREMLERSHTLAKELGWRSMREMCEELSGVDLGRLERQTAGFLEASEPHYEALVTPRLEAELGFGFDRLRSSDLAYFFRARTLDGDYDESLLLPSFEKTVAGLGLEGAGVRLDVEQRPKKTPRAFCAPVRVPDEVYLVIARHGGRDDYETLMHEAGHAEHFAHMTRELPMENRYLGDNSVTECFAFVFQHLAANPAWLSARLGLEDVEAVAAHSRATKLIYLRRYASKLSYELELHSDPPALDPLQDVYARRLSDALHIDWPRQSWLSDVDAFFYAACYIRAWALETHLRRVLRERFGERWFDEPEAGTFLKQLWRDGQRLNADEMLGELTGEELDFSALLDDLGLVASA